MTARRLLAARAKLVATVTTLLILISAGSAAAYWTASATLDGSASAATIGVTQTDRLDALAAEYTAGTLTKAGVTTVRNDGTAPGRYTLTVSAQSSTALTRALTVSISQVASTEQCTPGAKLAPLAQGTLTPSGLALSAQGDLAAKGSTGGSVVLCVRTSVSAQSVFLLGGEKAGLTVTSSLRYADGERWTARPGGNVGGTITQSVSLTPVDAATRMTCERTGLGIWATVNFSKNGALAGTTFRPYMIVDGQKMDLPASTVTIDAKNQRANVKIERKDLTAGNIFERPGKYWIVVEQQSAGGAVTNFGAGQFRYDLITGIHCGW